MTLNGKDLVLDENNELPDMNPASVPAGTLTYDCNRQLTNCLSYFLVEK